MDIDNILDSIMQYYSWIGIQTGLQNWQLYTIATGVLFLLILILISQRKARIKKIHIISRADRSDIIGIKLANNPSDGKHRTKNNSGYREDDDEQLSWGQTTKEWRRLREKIRELQHDINKYERIEKHLKEQILTLEKANKQLQEKINSKSQTTTTLENPQTKPIEVQQINPKTDYTTDTSKPLVVENSDTVGENSPKKDLDSSDAAEKDNNVPLDIKELKAIADLVKKLQTRSQQRQSE